MLNSYAQEPEAKTERSGETADLRLLPDVFPREPTGSGERTILLEHFSRKLKALDGRMLVQAQSSQLTKAPQDHGSLYNSFPFLYDANVDKCADFIDRT